MCASASECAGECGLPWWCWPARIVFLFVSAGGPFLKFSLKPLRFHVRSFLKFSFKPLRFHVRSLTGAGVLLKNQAPINRRLAVLVGKNVFLISRVFC